MKNFPPQNPLKNLKTTVRNRLEDYVGSRVEDWEPSRIDRVRRAIAALRQHYRELKETGSDPKWSYLASEEGMIAYALAYYPYYVELVPEVLSRTEFKVDRDWHLGKLRDPADGTIRYAFVGAGAGPEVYGLLRYISQVAFSGGVRETIRPNLSIELFEPAADSWKWLADAVTEPLITKGPWLSEQVARDNIRISWSNCTGVPGLRLPGIFDVIVVQMVLNEVSRNDRIRWMDGVLAENLADGGLLVVVDTNPAIHDELGVGFRKEKVFLWWSEEGDRRLDSQTSRMFFDGSGDLIEKRRVETCVSILERTEQQAAMRPPRPSVVRQRAGGGSLPANADPSSATGVGRLGASGRPVGATKRTEQGRQTRIDRK